MSEKISLTRALVMLKTLDKRIQKLTNEFDPLDIVVDKKLVNHNNQTSTEFIDQTKKEYQKLVDLIKQRNTIKSGIVRSNAITQVTIAGTTVSVAEAIERKTSIVFEKMLLQKLKSVSYETSKALTDMNDKVRIRLDRLLETTFSKDSTKVKTEEYEAVTKPFLDRNQPAILDPIDVKVTADRISENIDSFESEVDVVLSEINAITYIEI